MSKAQLNQFPHSMGLAPQQAQGVRALGPLTINFPGITAGVAQTYSDDFQMEEIDGTINAIQSLYFDTTQMSLAAVLTIQETGQVLTLPANSQGYIPIFAQNGMTYNVTTYGATTTLFQTMQLTFSNTPCQMGIWRPARDNPGFFNSVQNGGNATLNNQILTTVAVPLGAQVFVDGFAITGTGATAGGAVVATLTSMLTASNGFTGTMSFLVPVPTLPENFSFERVFDPPIMQGLITKSGKQISAGFGVILSVPAMGVGQTAAGSEIYWHLG